MIGALRIVHNLYIQHYGMRHLESVKKPWTIANEMKKHAFWKTVSTVPELPSGSVHVWKLSLTNCRTVSSHQSLSKDEIKRAERFRFKDDKERFVHRRSILKRLLSLYNGVNAAEILFAYNIDMENFLYSIQRKKISILQCYALKRYRSICI